MLRYLLVAACLAVLPLSVVAAPTQLISGLPSSYSPGQAVSFDVYLPAMSNLGSYNIDLILTSSVGTAGVDYYFDAAATIPASSHYIFPTAANYFDAVTVDSTTRNRITLSDFGLSGVNVVAGANDQVAKVVFRTLPTFHGQLNASVDSSLLILDTPDVNSTPIPGFSALQSDIAAAGVIPVLVVPEPSSLTLLMFVVAGCYLRRGRAA